ncbi:S8 family serine peptidase [Ruminiclostridium papyrosolvens]|uniref:Uncharacterized protein n=1 Tax=Ruminiclostridium papyrosolvens C7 TaxID=1330534 RepID=U4R0G5_9FIRM|nr:S8 family serine peptidase [Ruminiclostridium papyrosolvens]EPR11514.1 hypothetical protein L323_11675 [Ruminiclostridium papyrosolvens C7]
MHKKLKCISLVLVAFFMIQSILMPAIYAAAETENVVIELSLPQLSLKNIGITFNSVELVWTSSNNNDKAKSYDIYRDDNLIKNLNSFTYSDSKLKPETKYKYIVKTKDDAGKVIAESNVLEITTSAIDIQTTPEISTTPTGIAEQINLTDSAITAKESTIIKNGDPNFETDRYIIKYKNKDSKNKANKVLEKVEKVKKSKSNDLNNNDIKDIDIIHLNKKEKLKDFTKELVKNNLDSEIEYIQPDYQISLCSNDPYYNSQWGLENNKTNIIENSGGLLILDKLQKIFPHWREVFENNPKLKEFLVNTPIEELKDKILLDDVPENVDPYILEKLANDIDFIKLENTSESQETYLCDAGVKEAWKNSTGKGVTVAVIDTGIDITHEDLVENIWLNNGEISENGIDDDGNGKIDDSNGWNFIENCNVIYENNNIANENHGTHIAGIIAAVKDNSKGIAGVAPSAKIMPLKVFNNGTAYTSNIINAIQYAESMGVKIVNCSWGSTVDNMALKEVISNSSMLFVCSAGNSNTNIDNNPVYPASFNCSNIISVTSVNQYGNISSFSNYGESNVDVAAPGEGILSTLAHNTYGESNGTSMASAFVSGEVAILLSRENTLSAVELKDRIITCSEHLLSLTGKVNGSSKINCKYAVDNITNDEIISFSDTLVTQNNIANQGSTGDINLYSTNTTEGQFVKVAAGGMHSLALSLDGTVWAFGLNTYGQLGDGTTTNRTSPVQVIGLNGIKEIEIGQHHSLALKNDGTVWTWGLNGCGQLGDGTTIDRTSPVKVNGLSGITAIAAGNSHSLALKNDGTVWAWGENYKGQLGDGRGRDFPQSLTVVQVAGLRGITAIAAGGTHSLALKNDGTVWAWGDNYYGQLGIGTTETSYGPMQVSSLSGVSSIAAGGSHSIALKNDGTVWTWGLNKDFQIGDGSYESYRVTAVRVSGLNGIIAISGSAFNSSALKNDGTLWMWGNNSYGQLGNGTIHQTLTALQVRGLNGITAFSLGNYHSLALKNDGTVYAWGSNSCGQLGDGTTTFTETMVIQEVNELNGITALSGGNRHSLALKSDGTVWSWGYNGCGQLGDGTNDTKTTAVQVNGLSGITAISAGESNSLALKNDGTVWAWGDNSKGQLGDGTTTEKNIAIHVSGLSGIVAISAGSSHSVALKDDGTVWAWGYNAYGQLGDGTTTSKKIPIQVSGLSGIVAISAGSSHNLALKNDGTVWAWGDNAYGQLGDGTITKRTTAVQVSGLNGITAISAGGQHSLALMNDGSVWSWGLNSWGQLGTGNIINTSTAMKVNGLSEIKAIYGKGYRSFALRNDGTVWACGCNQFGELGSGTTIHSTKFMQISGLSNIKVISGGDNHSLALKNDGTVNACGYNYYGQLGIGEKYYCEYAKYSFGIPFTSITTACTVTCNTGVAFNLVLRLKNMNNITGKIFTITYNPKDINSIDLCKMTFVKELNLGVISGTTITIIQNNPGIIKFTVDKPIPKDKTWSGTINVIEFKPIVSGQVELNCKVGLQ